MRRAALRPYPAETARPEKLVHVVIAPVSYTHLDVYKRQLIERMEKRTSEQTSGEGLPVFVAPHDELERLTGFELTRGALGAVSYTHLHEGQA